MQGNRADGPRQVADRPPRVPPRPRASAVEVRSRLCGVQPCSAGGPDPTSADRLCGRRTCPIDAADLRFRKAARAWGWGKANYRLSWRSAQGARVNHLLTIQGDAFAHEAAEPDAGPAVARDSRRRSARRLSPLSGVLLQDGPNHREREFMQRLRGRGWVKALQLPDAGITLKRLLEKRWVESQGLGSNASYRITEEGIAAKTALIPLNRPSQLSAHRGANGLNSLCPRNQ